MSIRRLLGSMAVLIARMGAVAILLSCAVIFLVLAWLIALTWGPVRYMRARFRRSRI